MSKIKVQVLSDIHTEMPAYDLEDEQKYYHTDADLIIVAGDIAKSDSVVKNLYSLFPGKTVVFVAGNHEHYTTGRTIEEDINLIRHQVKQINDYGLMEAIFLENDVHILNMKGINIRLIGGTLWTDFDLFHDAKNDSLRVKNSLNDYYVIKGEDGQKLKPEETLSRHKITKNIIMDELLKDFDGPTIVVTHHLPSLRAVDKMYKKDRVSAGFASNLDELLSMGATLWCAGHTHTSVSFRDNDTLFVCNPEGYRRPNGNVENKKFNPKFIVDIRKGAPDNKWKAGIERNNFS
jgi:predicted phosphodiesterase